MLSMSCSVVCSCVYELKHVIGQGSTHDYPNPVTDVLVVCDVCLSCVRWLMLCVSCCSCVMVVVVCCSYLCSTVTHLC